MASSHTSVNVVGARAGVALQRRIEWFAYVFGAAPGAIVAILAAMGVLSESFALLLFAPSYIGLNLAHNAGTWSRSYMTDEGFRHDIAARVVIPALIVTSTIALEATGIGALLLAVQYYLSFHHGMMQNYGILRSIQRRAGQTLGTRAVRLDRAALLLAPFGALLYRTDAICDTYDGVTLAHPPEWLAPTLGAAGAIAVILYLGRELTARHRGESVDLMGVSLVIITNVGWTGLLLALDHPLLPLYVLASAHYIQQLYFVWRSNVRPGAVAGVPEALRKHVAPPSRAGFLLGLTLFGGIVVLVATGAVVGARELAELLDVRRADVTDMPPWLAAMIGINLSHYWLESRIWRAPKGSVSVASSS